MANFNSWTAVFTFLGFVLILAGTSMDSYSTNRKVYGFTNLNLDTLDFESVWEDMALSFGSMALTGSGFNGYNYANVCPTKGEGNFNASRTEQGHTNTPSKEGNEGSRALMLNRISAGMIAMLLLSVGVGFIASLRAILCVTNSTVTNDLESAKKWGVAAFLFTLVTWALWLRAYYEYLRPNNFITSDCRFHHTEFKPYSYEQAQAAYIALFPGASFGLAVASTLFYLLLFVHLSRGAKAGNSVNAQTVIQHAFLAFTGIFVAAALNSWAHGGYTTYDEVCSQSFSATAQAAYLDITGTYRENPTNGWGGLFYRAASNGNVHCKYENSYGVFTAFETLTVTIPYNDKQNRAAMSYFVGNEVEHDGSGQALVQGGRVVLGFAIAATILAFFSAFTGFKSAAGTFWINAASLACVVVSLLVWGITAQLVIQSKMCTYCGMGPSIGLLASGGIFLAMAIFYQAWVVADDVYVLPAHAYGMATKVESEQTTA